MKFVGTLCGMALMFSMCSLAGADSVSEHPLSFRGIPFGTDRDSVVARIVAELKMKAKFPVPESPFGNKQGTDLYMADGSLELTNYPVGNKRYTVVMKFNANNRLYAFTMKGPAFNLPDDIPALREHFFYLSQVYQMKYGDESREISFPQEAEQLENGYTYGIIETHRYAIGTGVVKAMKKMALSNKLVYVPSAMVCDKVLRTEEKQQVSSRDNMLAIKKDAIKKEKILNAAAESF